MSKYLGFNTTQVKTLFNILAQVGGATAAGVYVEAGDDGLAEGSVQDSLQALAARIAELESNV